MFQHHHNQPTQPCKLQSRQSLDKHRRADLAFLDPSYQPSSPSTSTYKQVYVDAFGNVHDPEFKEFPSDHEFGLHSSRRSSFDFRRPEDDDDEVEEADYAFGGKKSRYISSTSSTRSTRGSFVSGSASTSSSPYTPPATLYPPSSPRMPSSPVFSYSSALASDDSEKLHQSQHQHHSRSILKIFRRRPSHEFYDEDAMWAGDEESYEGEEEDEFESHRVPPAPTSSPASSHLPELEEEEHHQYSSKSRDLKSATRHQLQYLQLSVQLSLFRTTRKFKRTSSH